MSKDYEVGYGKPPKATQFKKGQSGNPSGKPKAIKNFDTELGEELNEKVTVNENGKLKKYTKRRLLIKTLAAKALKGDVRAALSLVKLEYEREGKAAMIEPEISKTDQKILDDFIAKHLNGGGSK